MSKLRDKAQGITKQTIGQMIGDDMLVQQGREQVRKAGQPTDPDDPDNDGPDRSVKRNRKVE